MNIRHKISDLHEILIISSGSGRFSCLRNRSLGVTQP